MQKKQQKRQKKEKKQNILNIDLQLTFAHFVTQTNLAKGIFAGVFCPLSYLYLYLYCYIYIYIYLYKSLTSKAVWYSEFHARWETLRNLPENCTSHETQDSRQLSKLNFCNSSLYIVYYLVFFHRVETLTRLLELSFSGVSPDKVISAKVCI